MTEQQPKPITITGMACSASQAFSEKPETPHYYSLKCEPCDVKWRSVSMAEECWACGEKRFQWK